MKHLLLAIILLASVSAQAIDINKECKTQFQPILDNENNTEISIFILQSVSLSDPDYYEVLFPALYNNLTFASEYARIFTIYCLSSKSTVKKVVDIMLNYGSK